MTSTFDADMRISCTSVICVFLLLITLQFVCMYCTVYNEAVLVLTVTNDGVGYMLICVQIFLLIYSFLYFVNLVG
jgi:hypothetical protein